MKDRIGRRPIAVPMPPKPGICVIVAGLLAAPGAHAVESTDDPFAQSGRLNRHTLILAVLARNPSTQIALEAWRQADLHRQRVGSLADPVVSYAFGPLSIVDTPRFGQVVSLSQRFPFFGKLGLQEEIAEALSDSAREGIRAVRLDLARAASHLFDELYFSERGLEIYEEHIALIEELVESAHARYAAGHGSQSAPMQAESELMHAQHERIVFESNRRVVVTKINGLLHRTRNGRLPSAPTRLTATSSIAAQQLAWVNRQVDARPDLAALRAQLRALDRTIRLAERRSYPDFAISGSYNTLWAEPKHRFMIGLSVDLPIQIGERDAAVGEAEARFRRVEAQITRAFDEAQTRAAVAWTRIREAQHIVTLYEERILPLAKDRVAVARAALESGRGSFSNLIDAERDLRTARLDRFRAEADGSMRFADLRHAAGLPPELLTERGQAR